jgi:hypothetical protein
MATHYNDGITVYQQRNQLLRRLRLARKSQAAKDSQATEKSWKAQRKKEKAIKIGWPNAAATVRRA